MNIWILAMFLLFMSQFPQLEKSLTDFVFVAKAEKKEYRIGEKVKLEYFVKNVGRETVYVAPPSRINFGTGRQFVGIRLYDSKTKKPVQYREIIKDQFLNPRLPLPEIVRAFYVAIAPGQFVGTSDEFDTGEARVPPGDYQIQLVYNNAEPSEWGESKLSEVKLKIAYGTISSNLMPVRIE